MRKRITSLLLTLAMLLSLVPAMGVTASAAEPEWTTVNSYADLKAAVDKGAAKVKLTADIDTTSENGDAGLTSSTNLTFKGGGHVLDLNGHTLKLVTSVKDARLILVESQDVTIKDSSTSGSGRIEMEFGENLANVQYPIYISSMGSLTIDGGTFSSSSNRVNYIECYGSLTINGGTIVSNSTQTVNLIKCEDANLTINGGKLQIPHKNEFGISYGYAVYTENRFGDNRQIVITGGEIDGKVAFTRDDSSATGTPKYDKLPVKITGGVFNQKVYAYYSKKPSGEITEFSPAVEIAGGTFKDVYNENLASSYGLATKLTAGTFEKSANIVTHVSDAAMAGYRACLGNSVILRGNECRTAYDWSPMQGFEVSPTGAYVLFREAVVISNAWGMKSVTLDGNVIDYAKDWKGAVEEMDNSTAHTIKFTWKDLAQELKDAHYSYNATCDRYISGSTKPETDKNLTGNEYSFTIPAGADPKVYSFDLQLNLQKDGSNIGIISNEHIVKLVVNQAPVVVPDPTLAGSVYYTSGIVFDHPISIAASVTPAEATKAYQWQRSTNGGSTWTNIEGETRGSYTPVEADMGENVRIRVKITAEGYLGEIVGAAVKVSKADNNGYPAVIQLEAVKDSAGTYNGFKIKNFDSDCEYVYSDTSTPDWSKNKITSDTVTGLTSNTTYYVFARFKETNTHTAGSIVSKNSIMLYDYVPLDRVLLEGYGSYGKIYIKQGESVTLKLSTDPSNVNYWNKITFKERGTATGCITVDNAEIAASGENAASFSDHTIKITGVSEGRATLIASYPSATESFYGTWDVVVYNDPADALRLENVYTYADITLSENDEAELPTDLPKLLPENSGYHLEWRIVKSTTHLTQDDNITLENGKIKPRTAHTGSEKTQVELVAVKDGSTTTKLLAKTSPFYVTVTKAPTITLTGVTVAPKKVNLANVGATCQLSAVKEPVNAAGILTWSSDKPAVAEVDNTGKVTAKAQGTAIITVSCGDKKATCTVTVAHTHDYTGQPWVYMDPGTHTKTCTAGDDTKYEQHTWQWVVDTPATSTTAGKKHEKCPDCGAKRNEGTEIPATGGGSSSGGGSSGGGGGAGVTTYAITIQNSKNGTVTASHKSAAKDTAVTLTVTPDKGYVLDTLTVLDSKDKAVKLTEKNGKYTFTMPSGKVTVSAAFKAAAPASENPFTDVPSGAYYEDAVVWAVKKDITSGTSATTFDPDGNCTRAQAVTFLWRAAGSPEPKSAAMPFTDVPAGSYFEKAVLWAVENGITKGTSDTTFGPDASCTRAQIVTFLWRAGGSPAVSGNSAFSDVATDAYYAAAVAWAEKNGVTGGIGGGLFGSDNTCTRAQIVTFLHRAMK